MAAPILVRFSNLRSLFRMNNNVIGTSSNTTPILEPVFRSCSKVQGTTKNLSKEPVVLSKAMEAYMKRAQTHEEFMKKETIAYETGKRHLANMMGIDPEQFTQDDIDKSLEYLFPSGLYDRKARPIMKHPDETYPAQKEAEFDVDGKPFHIFFYTRQPNYYEMLHNIVEQLQNLENMEDKYIKSNGSYPPEYKLDSTASSWISKSELEKKIIEKITDKNYEYVIKTLNKLLDHNMSKRIEDFIMKYRKPKKSNINQITILPVLYNEKGRPYVSVFPCQRKSSVAKVIVWGKGSGKITINGKDITYFKDMDVRKQDPRMI